MPLASMGCEAQVHEKTDKHGTWAYHLVDGWYLFTSPEHYRTHNCHIKHTKSERLSDTIQFQHKRIAKPTITHTNKVMHTLADCVKALHGMTSSARNSQAAQDLQRIIDSTKSPCTGTTQTLRGRRNTCQYPQHAMSSEGADTQHAMSSEGADATKYACTSH